MESVKSRKIIGGPSPDTVRSAIERKEKKLEELSNIIAAFLESIEQAKENLILHSCQ